ncbi:MAG: enoyl-CoA hydratase/isomerase family protein [Halobacteriales archaeon]|nr:enoyl-CoA hydratase/isomerase family protein [Halobacteriales archaeon]
MRYEEREEAVWLTFDRPEKANALAPETLDEFEKLLGRAEDDDVRAVVLTGAGEKFSAGADVDALAAADEDEARGFAESLAEVLRRIETLEIPVIAAVNGDAYGAGFETVVASDLAVAVEDARHCLPATHLGLTPPLTPERVEAVGGRKRASEIALTGEPIDAETAESWGVVNRAVSADELEDTVEGFVTSIAKADREATRVTKERIVSADETTDNTTTERFASDEARDRFRDASER